MKKIRAGIIGCGRIASTFAQDKKRKGIITHAQAYLANSSVEFRAACDLDSERLTQFGKDWKVPALYQDVEEMVRKEKLDLVSICTWNSSHAAIADAALKAGVKGIICEKPIADSLRASDRMIVACRKRQAPLLVNYTRRYVRLFHELKAWMDRGGLGDIQAVTCYYTAGTVNTGTHLFDFLRYFFGDVASVWADPVATVPSTSGDISVSGVLRFKKGFSATVTALDVSAYLVFDADIYGTKGRMRLIKSGTEAISWRVVPHPQFTGYKSIAPGPVKTGDLGEGLPGLVADAIRCIRRGVRPISSGEDGRAALEIAAALRLSAEADGRILKLPLKGLALDYKLSSK